MFERCGAKTRSGEPCKSFAMENGRCRMHGGTNTGAPAQNTNAVKHGFYSDALLTEERALYERADVDGIDDEIRLAKVKLHRYVLRAQSADVADLVDGALEVIARQAAQLDRAKIKPAKREIKAAAPQYADLILRMLDEIRKLMLARTQMALGRKALQEETDPTAAIEGFEVVEYEEDAADEGK